LRNRDERAAGKIPKITCALDGCNITFSPKQATQIYCSRSCRNKAGRKTRLLKQRAIVAELGDVTCPVCGITVQRTRKRQTTCLSEDCKHLWTTKCGRGINDNEPTKRKGVHDFTPQMLREEFHLMQYSPGEAICLCCGQTFASWDTKLNRICNHCKHLNTVIFTGSILKDGQPVQLHGG
jgi:hypothetical protein